MSGTVHQKFSAALDDLVAQIKEDRSILAVILCGSLSHDTVWAKSDIDLVLVTIDDKKVDAGDIALYADGVNVHALLMPRTKFRETVEGSVTNSFMHSFLAKGRLLYTHDPSIARAVRAPERDRRSRYAVSAARLRRSARWRASTRRTSGSSRAPISTTRRCGFCTPRRRLPRSRSSAAGCSPIARSCRRRRRSIPSSSR